MIYTFYDLHLCCDNKDCRMVKDGTTPYLFGSTNERTSFKNARKHGWIIDRKKNTAICPQCIKQQGK